MRQISFLLALFTILSSATCNRSKSNCYKGRLEIKGICMNYTIKLLEGNIDPSLIEASWKDEHSGITHQNVFGLGSVCSFPEGIAQGDTFYFTINNNSDQPCAVCKAYYPTPPKKLHITVLNAPCN